MNLETLLACLGWSWADDMFLAFTYFSSITSVLFGVMDSIGPAGHPDDRADQRSKEARNATGTELWEVMVRGFVPAGNSPAQPGFILSWIQSESTLESSVVNFDTT